MAEHGGAWVILREYETAAKARNGTVCARPIAGDRFEIAQRGAVLYARLRVPGQ